MSNIKKIFRSRFNDGYMMEADLSQIEIVVLAFLSQDTNLIRGVWDKVDFHCIRAAYVLGESYEHVLSRVKAEDEKYIKARKDAKSFSFARSYGAGAQSIADNFGLDIDVVKKLIEAEEALYPDVILMQEGWIGLVNNSAKLDWIEVGNTYEPKYKTASGKAAKVGKLKSVTGREYTFIQEDPPDWMKDREPTFRPTQIKNYPIQGLAGEIMRIILGKLYRRLKGDEELAEKALLVNTIHDSVLLDVHKDCVHKTASLVKATMEETPKFIEQSFGFTFNLPIRCDVEIGKNWLEMSEYKF